MLSGIQKILIVDDKEANLFSLEQILKETDAQIIRAQNGNDALAASLNHDFALALLDVQMPGMDGYELAEWLRSEKKNKDLPIIFVSAVYSSDYHVFKGYDAGAVDFMVKPYKPELLLGKVRVFLELDRQKVLLQQSREKLVLANDTLEQKVQERTAELETAIETLQIEIQKRKQGEQEIWKAKKAWQEIFEAIGQMTMILGKDHTILSANRAVLEHTGLALEKIIGQKCYSIFHNGSTEIPGCPMEKIIDSKNYKRVESEIDALGKTYTVSCTPVFNDQGQLEKIIHISTDITKHKQLKKELIQAHKMEAIGSLAGGIAHDFNNILSSVLGYTELSLAKVVKGSELEADLQQIYSAGIRARDLVKQILNFARQTDEEQKPVRIDIVAKEVIKFLCSTIPSTIEIKQNIFSRSTVLANPVKIHQLIMNLCTNAAYAMDRGGVLEISLNDVVLEEDDLQAYPEMAPGLYQKLEVSDTGVGIPADIIESIFQPFFTTKGIHEGTGMGLAMVHTVVKECMGNICVNSKIGKGTLFTILLPTTMKHEKTEQIKVEQEFKTGSETVLVVDDEAAICKLVSKMMQRYGYTVTWKTDSAEALALFSEQPDGFDLVITDMTMPKMAGDLLTRKILAIRPDMPVILATGYNRLMTDAKAAELGVRAFLAKPFEKAILLKTVRRVLDK